MKETHLDLGNIQPHSIILDLESTTKETAIHELITRAEAFHGVSNARTLERSILAREATMTTGFGRGVAISHGESADINHLAVALGISSDGVEYDAMDGKPVHIIFLVVNPVGDRAEYLDVLATLTALLRQTDVRNRLRRCACVEDVESTLRDALSDYGNSD